MKSDINSRADIEKIVDQFYGRVQTDALLSPVFSHIDLPKHLPTMYDFWASMMLGEQTYRGNPFQKHVGLPLSREHFSQWLALFTTTVDENFTGKQAEEIKLRAKSIADVFQHKLNLKQ
jgi:hemoglobin